MYVCIAANQASDFQCLVHLASWCLESACSDVARLNALLALDGLSVKATRNALAASSVLPPPLNALPRFAHAKACFGSLTTAPRKLSSAPLRSPARNSSFPCL
jgi:hypothetical protein